MVDAFGDDDNIEPRNPPSQFRPWTRYRSQRLRSALWRALAANVSSEIATFTRDVRDATKDLDAVSAELHALAAVLDPLARCISTRASIPDTLVSQVNTSLDGCTTVVAQRMASSLGMHVVSTYDNSRRLPFLPDR